MSHHAAFSRCWTTVGCFSRLCRLCWPSCSSNFGCTIYRSRKLNWWRLCSSGLRGGRGDWGDWYSDGGIHTPGQRHFIIHLLKAQVHKIEMNGGEKIKFISAQLVNNGVQLSVAAPRCPIHLRSTHTSTPDPHTHITPAWLKISHSYTNGYQATTWFLASVCKNMEDVRRAKPAVHGVLQS